MNIPINITLAIVVGTLLTILNHSLEKNNLEYKVSKSNVECGFESNSKFKIEFSNQFFIVAIVFLIFEIELIVIIPLPINQIFIISKIAIILILIALLVSLLIE